MCHHLMASRTGANIFALLKQPDRPSVAASHVGRTSFLFVGSAGAVSLPDSCVDYIFTDPPFGGNLMYSELNFLSECWLRVKTNNLAEAIQNDSQAKDCWSTNVYAAMLR